MTRLLVIPAAGRGSRLGFEGPKALLPIAGRPMIEHLLALYAATVDRYVVVVAPAALGAFASTLGAWRERVEFAVQEQPTGMLPAILCAETTVAAYLPQHVWITWCDQIAISAGTIEALAAAVARHPDAGLVMPTVRQAPPYIHFDRDPTGRIIDVRQRREGDVMPADGESDAGLFVLRRDAYLEQLVAYGQLPAAAGTGTGERNFLPFIPWLASRMPVMTVPIDRADEAIGVNTPDDVRTVEAHLRER